MSASAVYVGSYGNRDVGSDVSAARSPHLRSVAEQQSPLARFRRTGDDKNAATEPPPTNWVFDVAERVHAAAQERALPLDRWVAIPDGGLACYFFGRAVTSGGAHERVARLAFDNEQSTTLLLENLRTGIHQLTDEDPEENLDELLERVALHISG